LDFFHEGYLQRTLKACFKGSKPYPQKSSFPHPKSTIQATMQRRSVAMHCDASLPYTSYQTAHLLLVSTVCMKDKNSRINFSKFFKNLLFINDGKHCVTFVSAALVKKIGKDLVTQY